MKRLVILLVFQFVAVLILAQSEISGTVFNNKGEALHGATVIIEKSLLGKYTDQKGNFLFSKLKNGSFRIKVSFVGYETGYKDVDLRGNIFVEFSLIPARILADEVIISGIRAGNNTPVTYTNIKAEDLETKNLGQDVPFLLQKVPSLVTSSDAGTGIGYSSLRIRGSSPSRINVTIDGIPVNDPESHDVYWVDLPDFISTVDNVQVQRGVGTSTNGAGAFGASINFQTFKFRRDAYAELFSSAGSFNTLKNTISVGTGMINNKFTFNARLSKMNSDGFIDRAFADLKSFYLSGAYYTSKSILKFNINSGKEITYQAWGGVPSNMLKTNRTYNPYTYENEVDDYQQDRYQIHYSRELLKSLYLNASLFYIKGRGYYEQFKEDKKFSDYNLDDIITGGDTIKRTNLIQRKWLDNDFKGLTYSLNYTTGKMKLIIGGSLNTYDGGHFGKIIWAQHSSNSDINHVWYDNNGIKNDINTFVKVTYSPTARISLYGDIQFRNIDYRIDGIEDDLRDISQDYKYFFINPKLGLNYKIDEKQKVYISFATANREPNRTNLVDAKAGMLPGPETLYDYELGHEFMLENLMVSTNIYYMDYTDQLVLTGEINDVGSAIMVNVPESFRLGIEMVTSILPVRNVRWDFNLGLSKNKIRDFTEYVDDMDTWLQRSKHLGATDLSFSPSVIAGSEIIYSPIKNFSINLASRFVSKQYIDNTSSEERIIDPYFVNDLVINYKINLKSIKELGFYIKVINILNEEYETNAWVYRYYYNGKHEVADGYFPQAGIHFLAGISIKL